MASFEETIKSWSWSTAKFLSVRSDDLPNGEVWDFVQTAWISVALLFARVVTERIVLPIVEAILGDKKKAAAVFDDSYIAFFSALLEAHAVLITVMFNGGKNDHHVNIWELLTMKRTRMT